MSRQTFLNELHAQFGMPQPVVVELVERSCGRDVADVKRLIAGDENEVYRVGLTRGLIVYVRIGRPGMPTGKPYREAWAMRQARSAGVGVPEVWAVEMIGTDEDRRPAMVTAEAPGRTLTDVLPGLSPNQRRAVMRDLGRLLAVLHSVRMPGLGNPDDDGVWPDPHEHHRAVIGKCLAEREHLEAAGISAEEIDQAISLLESLPQSTGWAEPVLCHGDIHADHVFVDTQLRVCGLIDWGMWRGGPGVDDLATVRMRHGSADFDAILTGYGAGSLDDTVFRHAISLSTIGLAMMDLGWHLSMGNTFATEPNTTALRAALADISRGA